MKKQENKKGFTLVELIVVLVIIGILLAFLVPALTGYIRRAREKQVFAECRQCVTAAQTIASEQYSQKKVLEWTSPYEEVIELAEVSGTIHTSIRTDDKNQVIYLEYKRGDIVVVYERGHDPEYYISDGGIGAMATQDVSALNGYGPFVTDYFGSGQNYLDRWNAMLKWMQENEMDIELPQVSSAITEKAGLGDTTLYWRPYYLREKIGDKEYKETVIYYANTDNMKNDDGSWKSSGNWNASIVMIDGVIYRYAGSNKSNAASIAGMNNQNNYNMAVQYIEGQLFEKIE